MADLHLKYSMLQRRLHLILKAPFVKRFADFKSNKVILKPRSVKLENSGKISEDTNFFSLFFFLQNRKNWVGGSVKLKIQFLSPKQQIYCHIFTNMFGMNTSNCNCTPKGAYNVQVLLQIYTSQGFLNCTAPQQRPDSCQSETLAQQRLYRYFKLLISCYFLHTHTSYR